MKKVLLIMAAALMTMTQCRKQETSPATPSADTIKMTITAGPGAKTDINPETGAITWTSGDKLYVSDGAKWLGILTLQSGAGNASGRFTGDISEISDGTTCHFFYLGHDNDMTGATGTTNAVISFASQDGSKDDALKYHLGHGSAKVTVSEGSATAPPVAMKTEIAIAHLKLKMNGEDYTGSVTMDVSNTMTVSPAGDFSGSDDKGIAIGNNGGTPGDRYVTLIPTGTSSVDVSFSGSATGSMTFGHGIQANNLYGMANGIEVTLTKPLPYLPGDFTVSYGKTVKFSKGNLQYLGLAEEGHKWRFAEHQWDYMGDGPNTTTGKKGNVNLSSLGYLAGMYNTGSGNDGGSETDEDKAAARDLFGWGCTGYQDTRAHTYQMNYQPYSTSSSTVNATYNKYGYGPDYDGTNKYGLSVENKSDWGCLAIGEDLAGTWRTLTGAEWDCLLKTRTTETTGLPNASSRYAKVRVNGVSGMLLFPDSFAWDAEKMGDAPTKTNTASAAYTTGSYTVAQFTEQEKSGVVFLPAAGYRSGTSLNNVGSYGYYWSSACGNSYSACNMDFYSSSVIPQYYYDRYYGFSVRLVQ